MNFQLSSYILHYRPEPSLIPENFLHQIPGVFFEPATNQNIGVLIVEAESEEELDGKIESIQNYPWVTGLFLVHAQHEGVPPQRSHA